MVPFFAMSSKRSGPKSGRLVRTTPPRPRFLEYPSLSSIKSPSVSSSCNHQRSRRTLLIAMNTSRPPLRSRMMRTRTRTRMSLEPMLINSECLIHPQLHSLTVLRAISSLPYALDQAGRQILDKTGLLSVTMIAGPHPNQGGNIVVYRSACPIISRGHSLILPSSMSEGKVGGCDFMQYYKDYENLVQVPFREFAKKFFCKCAMFGLSIKY